MATVDQIAALRLLIAEDTEEFYADSALSTRIDSAQNNLDQVAYEIWVEKAARYAGLVSISEAGSSRSLSDLHDNALRMVSLFGNRLNAAAAVVSSGVTVRRLSRR